MLRQYLYFVLVKQVKWVTDKLPAVNYAAPIRVSICTFVLANHVKLARMSSRTGCRQPAAGTTDTQTDRQTDRQTESVCVLANWLQAAGTDRQTDSQTKTLLEV